MKMRWGWRRIHKWLAIVAGTFLLLWLISGIWISLPPPRTPAVLTANPVTEYAGATLSPADAATIARTVFPDPATDAIRLTRLGSRPIYRVPAPGRGRPILIDAGSGEVIEIDEAEASRIALEFYGGDGAPAGPPERIETRNAAYLHGGLPAYRFTFDDRYATEAYVAVGDGTVTWVDRRLFTRRWMAAVHGFGPISDFLSNRLRIALLLFGSAIAMVATLTGYWLAIRRKRRA